MDQQPTAPARKNICTECANADSWGLPDKPCCRLCSVGSEWQPLNKSSVNKNMVTTQARNNTPPSAAVPAQPDALQDFEIRKLAAIPAVDEGRLVERRPVAYRRGLEDQFVCGFRAAESRLRAQVAALTQGAAERPEPLKDHQIAALVNELRDIALQYHGTQQLRERIAQVVVPTLRAGAAERAVPAAMPITVTEEMGMAAAVKVLLRASGLDGLPQRMLDAMLAASPAQPAPKQHGEQDAQLDIDSDPIAPGQQRNVAGAVAMGQPVGDGQHEAGRHTQTQGNKLLAVAKRNLRRFLETAVFRDEADRQAALNCLEVLINPAQPAPEPAPAQGGREPQFEMGRGYIERSIGGTAYKEGWHDCLAAFRAARAPATQKKGDGSDLRL